MNKILALAALLLGVFAIGFAMNNSPAGAFIGPRVVAKVNLVNQTSQIPLTTIFTPPTSGMFRVSVYETMTAPGDGNGVVLNWTDTAGLESANIGGLIPGSELYCVSAAGPPPCGTTIFAVAGTPIGYMISTDGHGGTYDLHIVIERLE